MQEKIIDNFKNVNWFKVILYISLIFLGISLYQADYLVLPKIHSPTSVWISIFFLMLGFVLMCDNWRVVLKQDNVVNISFKEAIVSNGLYVFAKYIPGKVMVIIGRATYISNKYSISTKKLSFISFKVQIITLWIGLSIGTLSIMKLNPSIETISLVLLFILFFTIFLFSKGLKKIIVLLVKKLVKRDLDYPLLTATTALKIIPSFIFNWTAWCISFYYLVDALIIQSVPLLSGASFALAATLAIVALIAPGGLGVREGILVATLIGFGIEKQDAITISVASRLWFLVGEVFIFLLAVILNNSEKRNLQC
jgi:uncharacterized membrane protein YbhN (UPF0104 family)